MIASGTYSLDSAFTFFSFPLQCSYGHCQVAFHPSCARDAGFYMNIKTIGGRFHHKAYCEKHSVEQRQKVIYFLYYQISLQLFLKLDSDRHPLFLHVHDFLFLMEILNNGEVLFHLPIITCILRTLCFLFYSFVQTP